MNEKYEIYDVDAEMFNCNLHFPDTIAFKLKWVGNVGFGELSFLFNTKTKEWSCDTECMGKDFCEAVLNKWLEGIDKWR